MTDTTGGPAAPALIDGPAFRAGLEWVSRRAEAFVIPLAALIVGMALFSVFIALLGKSPAQLFELMWRGGFGCWFSIQNTLSRAAPLLLAALCVALPARLGLVVIGGEGAIVLGGVAAAAMAVAVAGAPSFVGIVLMGVAGMVAGGIWIGAVGALRHYRAVNETISSLLMAYIAIALMNHLVEGPLRDPASLNKPSTHPIDPAFVVGAMPGMDVHWGLAVGVVACVISWVLIEKTRWGFAARIAGGNVRAAQVQGLAVGPLIVGFTRACRRLRRAGGDDRGRGRAGQRQRLARGGLRLFRHPRRLPGAAQSAGDHSGGDPAWRHRRLRRPAAAAHGPARRDSAGAARDALHRHPVQRDLLRPLQDLQSRSVEEGRLMESDGHRPVGRAAGHPRRRDPGFHAVHLRLAGRSNHRASGRINLGLEGMLVFGAMTAYAVAVMTARRGSACWRHRPRAPASACSMAGSAKFPKVNDIAIGIALMLFGSGLAFFFGKPFIQPSAPDLPAIPFGGWSSSPQVQAALNINVLFLIGAALAVFLWWAFKNTRAGLDRARRRRQFGRRARHGPQPQHGAAVRNRRRRRARGDRRRLSLALLSRQLERRHLVRPGPDGGGAGDLRPLEPARLLRRRLLFGGAGALGPALQSVGVTQGYYLFYAAPYILTLLIMIATSSPGRSLAGAPGELSITK